MPFKVIQGRQFREQSEARMRLPTYSYIPLMYSYTLTYMISRTVSEI